MIASTPIMGGHYFVDLIGGALLVIAVVLIDKTISYSRPASCPPACRPSSPNDHRSCRKVKMKFLTYNLRNGRIREERNTDVWNNWRFRREAVLN